MDDQRVASTFVSLVASRAGMICRWSPASSGMPLPLSAADLRAGDRVVMDGDVVVVESVMRSGDRVYVRADGVPVSALAGVRVERVL